MRAITPSPSRAPLAIGDRLRAARRAQGMTLADLAAATGLNKGFLSKVERDETSPSVTTLVAICEVLSLSIGSLFEGPEVEVIDLDEAPRINMGGADVIDRLVTPRHESRLQILRSTLAPGSSGGDDLYTINCDIEVLHVISGAVDVQFTDGKYRVTAGQTMRLRGREPHTWHNAHDGDTELIWTLAPAAWSGSAP